MAYNSDEYQLRKNTCGCSRCRRFTGIEDALKETPITGDSRDSEHLGQRVGANKYTDREYYPLIGVLIAATAIGISIIGYRDYRAAHTHTKPVNTELKR